MYNNNEVISYLQANKILALKLDHAVSSVGEKVRNQVDAFKYATQCPYGTRCGYGCGGFGYIWSGSESGR